MKQIIFMAISLILVLEGLAPLLSPNASSKAFERLAKMSNGQLHFVKLTPFIVAAVLVGFVAK